MPSAARAELRGDPQLLLQVADAHQANREQIRTWRGRAHVEDQLSWPKHDPPLIRRAARVVFVLDQQRQRGRSNFATYESFDCRGPERTPGMLPVENFLAKDNVFYGYSYDPKFESELASPLTRLAQIRPSSERELSALGYDFCPTYFLTAAGCDVAEIFRAYHQCAKEGKRFFPATVSRKGDIVVLEVRGNEALNPVSRQLVNRYTVDLGRGANPVGYEGGTDLSHWVSWKYEQEKMAGVWVPKKVVVECATPQVTMTRSIEWTENILNEPIGEEEFTLRELGIREGDEINDQRSGVRFVARGDEFLPREEVDPADRIAGRPTFLYLGMGITILVLAAVMTALQRRRRRRREASR
jgi:hypothetical protein